MCSEIKIKLFSLISSIASFRSVFCTKQQQQQLLVVSEVE
jgi:hypothetical protein